MSTLRVLPKRSASNLTREWFQPFAGFFSSECQSAGDEDGYQEKLLVFP
jgi:hypothetical protein